MITAPDESHVDEKTAIDGPEVIDAPETEAIEPSIDVIPGPDAKEHPAEDQKSQPKGPVKSKAQRDREAAYERMQERRREEMAEFNGDFARARTGSHPLDGEVQAQPESTDAEAKQGMTDPAQKTDEELFSIGKVYGKEVEPLSRDRINELARKQLAMEQSFDSVKEIRNTYERLNKELERKLAEQTQPPQQTQQDAEAQRQAQEQAQRREEEIIEAIQTGTAEEASQALQNWFSKQAEALMGNQPRSEDVVEAAVMAIREREDTALIEHKRQDFMTKYPEFNDSNPGIVHAIIGPTHDRMADELEAAGLPKEDVDRLRGNYPELAAVHRYNRLRGVPNMTHPSELMERNAEAVRAFLKSSSGSPSNPGKQLDRSDRKAAVPEQPRHAARVVSADADQPPSIDNSRKKGIAEIGKNRRGLRQAR